MSIQLHPRYFQVAEADSLLKLAFIKIEQRLDMTIDQVVGILLAIATETNKVEILKERKVPHGLGVVGKEFFEQVLKAEEKYGLTQGESMKILLGAAMNMNKSAIRAERHPNDPDRKGDEA